VAGKFAINSTLLRAWRDRRGLSQNQLAQIAGLAVETIRRIETGRVQPSTETLKRLTTALELPLSELLTNADPGEEKTIPSHVRRLRLEQSMSLRELAQRANISASTLSRLERGERASLETIQNIANALKINLDEILPSAEPLKAPIHNQASTLLDPDFEIQFAPEFSPVEVKSLLTTLASYYRACGGVGLRVKFQVDEVPVTEPIHV
jgi:transcriptional regulator with XRE-family HTH domain